MSELITPRLRLRRITLDDAELVMRVMNTPGFIRFVGDRGLREVEATRNFLQTGPLAQADDRLGLWRVARKEDDVAVGAVTLLQRPFLDAPDLGYALLPEHERRGYAFEAAAALRDHARVTLGFDPLYALTSPDNDASIRLLGKLGFAFVRLMQTPTHSGPSRLLLYRPPGGD